MVDILLVLEGAAYVGFIAGAIFAVLELRGIARDRRTHLVVDVFTRTSDPGFAGAVIKIMGAEFKDAKEAKEMCTEDSLMMVGHYFEGLGLLLARGLVDEDLLLEVWPYDQVFDKMKPYTAEIRKKYTPDAWEWFEYLANEERKYVLRRDEEGLNPSSVSAS